MAPICWTAGRRRDFGFPILERGMDQPVWRQKPPIESGPLAGQQVGWCQVVIRGCYPDPEV